GVVSHPRRPGLTGAGRGAGVPGATLSVTLPDALGRRDGNAGWAVLKRTTPMISISSPVIDSLRAGFDEARGLWRLDRPGHTRPVARLAAVHSGVLTAQRLMRAAQLGALDALPVARCLEALRGLQCADGSHLHGCFRWYAEEPAPVDTNAAFFTGLNLILLEGSHGGSLAAGDRATLRA